jgi:hypothetical protein
VLFDAAHKNVAGNADWIVDANSPDPMPANPTSETSWSGGISAWGFDLFASGRYAIHQLGQGTALTWQTGGAGDLSNFDVFITVEPEANFTTAEQNALWSFAQAGGGMVLVSDHQGAARCSGCVEAWTVLNAFVVTGPGAPFGLKFDGNDVGSSGLNGTATTSPYAPHFTSGPFGAATTLVYHSGSSVSTTGMSTAASVVVNSTSGGMMAASELTGGGRLVILGDSSPPDDGTCTGCSAQLYNGWGEGNDAHFLLNATAWAAHDGS